MGDPFPRSPMKLSSLRFLLTPCLLAAAVLAQWNPGTGQWFKSDARDVRVMTWNVKDGICSNCPKTQGTQWDALARIVASLRPDVLVLQEAGDNPSGRVDSVATLTQVLGRFLRGGSDPWRGGSVTAYVARYASGYDLPHVFVSARTDGYNRNVILSRFPFRDLNGDGRSVLSDIPPLRAHAYQNGGNGGIRGFAFAEIDLPSMDYTGDLVVGNAHLKAGRRSSDASQREQAARNVAYVVDYWYQGAGLGRGPDPFGKIGDSPAATRILDARTPVVLAGDWNEDEASYSGRGPAAWLSQAARRGGTDGTDRDRSDMSLDGAVHVFTRRRGTYKTTSSKLDYVAFQDSIARARRAFMFDTAGTPSRSLPGPLKGMPSASALASDHRPVVVDLILPGVICQRDLGFAGPGTGRLSLCGGSLATGTTADLEIRHGAPWQPGWLAIATRRSAIPALGGTLVPFPGTAVIPILLDGAGSFSFRVQGGGGPQTLYLQVIYRDAAQRLGFAFTNALEAVWRP